MRPLEILDSLLLIIYLLWPSPRPIAVDWIPALACALLLLHLAFERYRWQMIPLYALSTLLMICGWVHLDIGPIASFLTLGTVALSTALPTLLPVPRLSRPGGPFAVGTRMIELTDATRLEIYGGWSGPREFIIQVWYPAALRGGERLSPWMQNARAYASAIARYIRFPAFFLDHLELVRMPAYQDAAVLDEPRLFPLILFSHGWNGFGAQNTSQALELASRGYVVAALHHTYGAVVTVFSDGRIAANDPTTLPLDESLPAYDEIAGRLGDQWSGDMVFVLDQFESKDSAALQFLAGRIDLGRVGAYGHSTGGGAAVQLCGIDARVRAVLGMDPFLRPISRAVIARGIEQPAFFMFSELWAGELGGVNNRIFHELYARLTNARGAIEIRGTRHFDFCDVPVLSPIGARLGLKGPLNGRRAKMIVESYLLDFFDATLKGQPATLIGDAIPKYREVRKLEP